MVIFTSDLDFFSLQNEIKYAHWLENVAKFYSREILELSVTFLSDDSLLEMNINFLEHDEYTDILTFDLSVPGSNEIIGDIYISIDRVRDNAQSFNVDFYSELARVMVHGLLHLIGYNDKDEEESQNMRFQENLSLGLLVL